MPERCSALALPAGRYGRLDRGVGVTFTERRGLAIVQVAAWPDTALDLPLPGPGRAAGHGGGHILWVGPRRWWLVVPDAEAGALRASLLASGAAVTDHGHGRTVLRLAGPQTAALLAKGCPLDLHPSAFAPGACAGTLLGPYTVTLHRLADDAFDLYLARSYAMSAWDWLTEAAGEFGYEVRPA